MKINLKKARWAMARQCMTYADIADASGLSLSTVKHCMVGDSGKPATLGRICRALHVNVDAIIEEE